MNNIDPTCPICHLVNIIFDDDTLPRKCQFCGNDLIEKEERVKYEKNR